MMVLQPVNGDRPRMVVDKKLCLTHKIRASAQTTAPNSDCKNKKDAVVQVDLLPVGHQVSLTGSHGGLLADLTGTQQHKQTVMLDLSKRRGAQPVYCSLSERFKLTTNEELFLTSALALREMDMAPKTASGQTTDTLTKSDQGTERQLNNLPTPAKEPSELLRTLSQPLSSVSSTDNSETEILNAEVLNTEVLNTEALNTEVLNTEALNTEVLNTEVLHTGVSNTEVLKTEVPKTEVLRMETDRPQTDAMQFKPSSHSIDTEPPRDSNGNQDDIMDACNKLQSERQKEVEGSTSSLSEGNVGTSDGEEMTLQAVLECRTSFQEAIPVDEDKDGSPMEEDEKLSDPENEETGDKMSGGTGPDEAMDTDASDRDSMNVVDRPQVSSVTDNKKEGNRIPETSVRRVKNTVTTGAYKKHERDKEWRINRQGFLHDQRRQDRFSTYNHNPDSNKPRPWEDRCFHTRHFIRVLQARNIGLGDRVRRRWFSQLETEEFMMSNVSYPVALMETNGHCLSLEEVVRVFTTCSILLQPSTIAYIQLRLGIMPKLWDAVRYSVLSV